LFTGCIVLFMALWAAYNFYIVGETCRLSESETLSEVLLTHSVRFFFTVVDSRRGPSPSLLPPLGLSSLC
jgi:hypothetical protein